MTAPVFRLPGAPVPATPRDAKAEQPWTSSPQQPGVPDADAAGAPALPDRTPRTVDEVLADTQVESVLDELDTELVGLQPVKQKVRELAALLVIDRLRA